MHSSPVGLLYLQASKGPLQYCIGLHAGKQRGTALPIACMAASKVAQATCPYCMQSNVECLLLRITAFPHWWESNVNRFFVAMVCSVATICYMVWTSGQESIGPMLDHAIMKDFIPFIILLFSLYVISGGIYLSGDLAASPKERNYLKSR